MTGTVTKGADVLPYGAASTPVLETAGTDPRWVALADSERYPQHEPDLMLSDKMPTLVKGIGYSKVGGNMPLSDDEQIFKRAMRAETVFRESIAKSANPETVGDVLKGVHPDFAGPLRAFMQASPQNQALKALTGQLNAVLSDALGKSITLTSPLSSGFVPFDLVAPSRLV